MLLYMLLAQRPVPEKALRSLAYLSYISCSTFPVVREWGGYLAALFYFVFCTFLTSLIYIKNIGSKRATPEAVSYADCVLSPAAEYYIEIYELIDILDRSYLLYYNGRPSIRQSKIKCQI